MKKSYSDKLRDPRWQKKRLRILERDCFACIDCGTEDKQLHVHHCFYERGEPWEIDDRFLLTLCADCHDDRQSLEADLKRAVGIIFSELDKDNLNAFTTSAVYAVNAIERLKELPDYERGTFLAEIRDGSEVEWLSDIRWFNDAYDNKDGRKAYERIIGRRPKWGKR